MSIKPVDERKPAVPYVKGWQFTAQQHVPPPTQPSPGDCTIQDLDECERMKQLHPIERCVQHLPPGGSYGPYCIDLRVHDTIHVGDERHAQVVVVEVLTAAADLPVEGLSKGQHVVAKIDDPLYALDDDFYTNIFASADKRYTHEVAAYGALSDFQGSSIPHYYGSYSLNIPVEPSTKRHVRLILMELIPGSPMKDVDPRGIPRQIRQNILKSLVEFETWAFSKDIVIDDTHPRNIMLTDPASEHARVFVDFGDVLFGWIRFWSDERPGCLPSTYISPLLRWHEAHSPIFEFKDWVDWDWQTWLEAEFGHTAVLITPEMRQVFLPERVLKRRSQRN